MTREQKIAMANAGKQVLVNLQTAVTQLHEIEVLIVEKAASGLIADAASMILREITERCKP